MLRKAKPHLQNPAPAQEPSVQPSAFADSKKRQLRPYPASPFEEALPLGEAIHQFASGEKVRRLTLLKQLNKSPTSSSTRMLITNSSRYGITLGSHSAEWLELTPVGAVATSTEASERQRREARFKLAIEGVPVFNLLYSEYRGKKLPSHDVLKDAVIHSKLDVTDHKECVDIFIVNAKFLGLLQTIAGSETLLPIEQVIEEIPATTRDSGSDIAERVPPRSFSLSSQGNGRDERNGVDWSKTCFVISPIGDEASETRKHADLFLSSLIEPALTEFGLNIVRADRIGAAGMITSQIFEYLLRSRLAIADLSYHNPNAFYEMAIRHATKLPIVQISRKADRLPFDVNQVRTVVIDTTDIYSLVPRLETYRSEIATQVRAALAEGSVTANPLSVFFPGFEVSIPRG